MKKEREIQIDKRKKACRKKRIIHGGKCYSSSFVRKREDSIKKSK